MNAAALPPPVRLAAMLAVLLVAMAGPVRAGDAESDRLFARMLAAPTEAEGRAAEDAIWRFWMAQGPTPEIRKAVERAMSRRSSYDFAGAKKILDDVVATAPDYAEGWNQRAFILFLQQKPDEALDDIDRALALEPRHFAALAGRATILMQQGRMEPGQKALRQAVAIHPWLKERSMLIRMPGEAVPPVGRGI